MLGYLWSLRSFTLYSLIFCPCQKQNNTSWMKWASGGLGTPYSPKADRTRQIIEIPQNVLEPIVQYRRHRTHLKPFHKYRMLNPGYITFKLLKTVHKCDVCSSVAIAVHHADIHLHAGLARSDCVHLPPSLYLFQHLEYLPKCYHSGGGHTLPGPTPVW